MDYVMLAIGLAFAGLLWIGRDLLRDFLAATVVRRCLGSGDQIRWDQQVCQTRHIGWLTTTLTTEAGLELIVPNRCFIERGWVKLPLRGPVQERSLIVACPADAPPTQVRRLILDVLLDCLAVLPEPPPRVLNVGPGRYRIVYQLGGIEPGESTDSTIHDLLWYALRRRATKSIPPEQITAEAQERQALLRSVPLFAGLPAETLADLARTARNVWYTEGETVVRQGMPGDEMYLIRTGEVEVLHSAAGREREIKRLTAGAFFGEMALLTGERRSATIRALRDTALIVLNQEDLASLLNRTPALVESIRSVLQERQAELDRHAADALAARDGQPDCLFMQFSRRYQLTW